MTINELADYIDVNPIYEWADSDIWEYIGENKLKYNPLYDRGYKRVGCIGCPFASRREIKKEFEEYPKIKDAYIRAFQRMLDALKKEDPDRKRDWESGQEVFDWWTEKWKNEVKGQMSLEDFIKD